MRLWERDKEEYVRQYVEGITPEPEPWMRLGSVIHSTLETPEYPWMKEMVEENLGDIVAVRKALNKMSKKLVGEPEVTLIGKTAYGTSLMAVLDRLDRTDKIMSEYKTTNKKGSWTQWRVDNDDQLSFYAYVYKLTYHSFFKEIRLHEIDTVGGCVKVLLTARGPRDIGYIAEKVERVCDEIHDAGFWEKRLSREDREKLFMKKLL